MLKHPKFRASTWGVDAIIIWATAISTLATWIAALVEGYGMAISLLIAFAVFPLALLTMVLLRNYKKIVAAAPRIISSIGQDSADILRSSMSAEFYTYDAPEEASDTQAYYQLVGFLFDYLLPTCKYQIALQRKIIKILSANSKIAGLALAGLQYAPSSQIQDFWLYYDRLIQGLDASEPIIKYSAMVDCIRKLEKGAYKNFYAYGEEIAASSGFDYKTDDRTREEWERWRQSHNALIHEYEKIKRDPRFGKLMVPRRPSRWGDEIRSVRSDG